LSDTQRDVAWWQAQAVDLLESVYLCSDKERLFVRSMRDRQRMPTPRQAAWLNALYERASWAHFPRAVEAGNFDLAIEIADWISRRQQ
jgi:hypothetical protein